MVKKKKKITEGISCVRMYIYEQEKNGANIVRNNLTVAQERNKFDLNRTINDLYLAQRVEYQKLFWDFATIVNQCSPYFVAAMITCNVNVMQFMHLIQWNIFDQCN